MEETLRESLNRVQMHKKYLGNQLISLDCAGEFHNGMHLPMAMTNEQQSSHMQWLHDSDDRYFMLPGVSSLLPQRNLECSTETSLQGYNGYFGTEKQASCSKHGQEESLNDLGHNSCLQLQLGAQYPYDYYDLDLLGEKKFKPNGESLQEGHVDFHFNSFEPPRPGFDAGLQTWVATSGPCGVPMFDDHPYTQPKQT